MSVIIMHKDFRRYFPNISKLADQEHHRVSGKVNPIFSYSWFSSLAKSMNLDMRKELHNVRQYQEIFVFICDQYIKGDDNIRNCIDSTFIENIFLLVPVELSQRYWKVFPVELKERYMTIHGSNSMQL